jgi:hypothetical protein
LNPAIGLWRTLRELGLAAGTLYASARVLSQISRGKVGLRAYYLVAQPVALAPALPARRGRSIEVREIGLAEALELPVDRPRAVIERRMRHGARCLVARSDGRFLGFLWFQLAPYEEDEVRCLFVPSPKGRASWDFDVFVQPSARLGFAFARLWDEANAILSKEGIRWSISRISMTNASSLAAHRRLGLVRLGSAAFVCAGDTQVMLSTLWPFVHVALRRSSRPKLELNVARFEQ